MAKQCVKIECYSQVGFESQMRANGLNDSNVDSASDLSFISIIGTKECLEFWLKEADTEHYFNGVHNNVLNLEFDDLSRDFEYKGHLFKAFSMTQAESAVDFIEKSINEGVTKFYVHCRAGVSRSRAFCEVITRICEDKGIDVDYEERDVFSNKLNFDVLRKLMNAYWKKHKINGYEDGSTYPDDLLL